MNDSPASPAPDDPTTPAFVLYPAIDLRGGQVVRLAQGDPARQTTYDPDPACVAARWVDAGARWLHVVNLDGAFGAPGSAGVGAATGAGASAAAVVGVLAAARRRGAELQLSGGLRTAGDVERALGSGVSRVVLGTVAVEQPALVAELVARHGAARVAVGIDARDGLVCVRGWVQQTNRELLPLARELGAAGVRTLIYTDIARDGVRSGVDVAGARRLADHTGLEVIASGGVASLDDVRRTRAAGLAGLIVGRALYEGLFTLPEALAC